MIIYFLGAIVTLVILGYCYGKFDWYENLDYMPQLVLLFPSVLWPIAVPLILLYLLLRASIKFGAKKK